MKAAQIQKNGKPCWTVSVPARGKHPQRRFFASSKEEVERKAGEAIAEDVDFGAMALDPQSRALVARWTERLQPSEMEQALQAWIKTRPEAISVANAVAKYIAAPRPEKLDPHHITSRDFRLLKFTAAFSGSLLALSAGQIGDFIAGQGRSAPNYHRTLRALFRHAARHRWVSSDPFEHLERPVLAPLDRILITPKQMRVMLRIALGLEPGSLRESPGRGRSADIVHRHDCLLRLLILGGFLGMRTDEIKRAKCSDYDAPSATWHVPRMKTKRRGVRERWIQLLPMEVAWIKELKLEEETVLITEHAWLCKIRARAAERAGLDGWPENGLRRAAASYHIAAFEDAARSAERLGHTDASTTKSKYQVVRQQAEALKWWNLTPDAVR